MYMCFPCYQEFPTLEEVLTHQLTCTAETTHPVPVGVAVEAAVEAAAISAGLPQVLSLTHAHVHAAHSVWEWLKVLVRGGSFITNTVVWLCGITLSSSTLYRIELLAASYIRLLITC